MSYQRSGLPTVEEFAKNLQLNDNATNKVVSFCLKLVQGEKEMMNELMNRNLEKELAPSQKHSLPAKEELAPDAKRRKSEGIDLSGYLSVKDVKDLKKR